MLAFVAAIITVAGRGAGRTWWLVAAGFGVFAIADAIYLYEVAIDGYRENTILDAGWPLAFLLLAVRRLAARTAPRRPPPARRGHAGPARGAGVVAIGILVLDHYARQNDLAVWLASAALGVIVVRFALTFRENLRMLQASEADATTDALTGLANRRALAEDLTPRRGPAASSRCSISTASSPTTTRSGTPPATRCSSASGATSSPRSATRAAPTGWAATSSA